MSLSEARDTKVEGFDKGEVAALLKQASQAPEQAPKLMVVCAGGVRSVFVIARLINLGYPAGSIYHANAGGALADESQMKN